MKATRPYTPKTILKRIRKLFPLVNRVVDSNVDLYVSVTEDDSSTSKKKDPANCAFANACARCCNADGAIINIGTAYVIKGNVATRFRTTEGVAREIVSFDRHQDFAPGHNYRLGKITKARAMGARRGGYERTGNRPNTRKPGILHRPSPHRTSGIRVTTSIGN